MEARTTTTGRPSWAICVAWVVLAIASFIGSIYIASGIVWGLGYLGIDWSLSSTVGAIAYRVLVYVCMGAIMVGVAYWARQRVRLAVAGLSRVMNWRDIGLGVLGVLGYFLLSAILLTVASHIPGFDGDQAQDVGLGQVYAINQAAAFVALVILTPFFEELLFRGILYGKLRAARLPWWASALVVSVLFGLAHMQWNVGIDVFALSLEACSLREITGTIWAGVLLHVIKNLIAFYFTFVVFKGF